MTYNEIQSKANGLHSGTCIDTEYYMDGTKEEWHRHPETGEIVVIRGWNVDGGDGDVMPEFEVIEVIPKGGYLGKLQAECEELKQDLVTGKAFGLN